MIYLTNLNLNQNELQNAVIQPLAAAPSNPRFGQIYCNSTTKKIMWYNGTDWEPVGSGESAGTTPSSTPSYEVPSYITTLTQLRAVIANDSNLQAGQIFAGHFTDTFVDYPEVAEGEVDLETGEEIDPPTPPTIVTEYDYLLFVTAAKTDTEKCKAVLLLTQPNGKVSICYAMVGGTAATVYDLTPVQSDWNQTNSAMADFIKNKPTKLSDFENDAEFVTRTVNNLTNYYTSQQIDQKLEAITSMNLQKVDELPTENISTTTIYLLRKQVATANEPGEPDPSAPATPEIQDVFEEYIFVDGNWEFIGNTQINLEGYVKSEDLAAVATSGDYNDLQNKPTLVKKGEATLSTTETSKVITVGATETILMISIMDAETFEEVLCDIEYATADRRSATISVADAPTNDLKIVYAYI